MQPFVATEKVGQGQAPPVSPSLTPDSPTAFDRVILVLATFVCLFFVAGLRDVGLARVALGGPYAPPLPASVTERDATLDARVVEESGGPVAGASIRLYALRDGKAYFAGERIADADGRARAQGLPRGELWALAYGGGRSRASTRLVLDAAPREVTLVLHPAAALDVIVVDPTEKPVTGASIELTTSDPLPYQATTGEGGKARLDRLGPPPYVVRVRAAGFDETVRTGVVPGPVPLRIKLDRSGALEVVVVDSEGKPAPGATVLAAGTGLWPARMTPTDDLGAARIAGLRDGAYDLKARRGDEVSKTELAVTLKRGEVKSVRLVLQHGRHVAVTVTDGEGEGAPVVKDAGVVLVEDGLSSFPLQGRTNEKGIVVLGPIASGPATVSARASGFVARSAVAVGEAATEVRIALSRGGALVGDVKDDRGYPVGGATIEVVGVDAEGMPIDETTAMADFRDDHFEFALTGPRPLIPMGELGVMPGPIPDLPHGDSATVAPHEGPSGETWVTRSDGTFRAEPIPPGRVHAIVRHPSYVEATSEDVTLRPGGEAVVHIVLRQGGSLEGRVVEENRRPVAGARIELAATKGSLERITYAADDGTFAFAAVPDEVLLSVSRPEAPADVVVQVAVQVPDRERKEIEIILPTPRGDVKIHVTDDRDYPLDRVEVKAVSLDVDVPLRRTFFTNGDGDTVVPDAVGVPLRLELRRPTKAPRVEQIPRAPAELRLAMAEGLHGHGNVTGRDGRDRVAGAEVRLFTAAGARHARSDDEGAFTVDDLGPGRVRIVVSHSDYATNEIVVNASPDARGDVDLGEIDLAEAGEVAGLVVDAEDQPVAGARVAQGAVPTWLPLGPLPPGIVATDREGRFTLGGLPEGDVALEAYFADLGRGYADAVPVRAGRTTSRVKITLPGGEGKKEPKGAGSVAVTLGERREGSGKVVVVVMVPPASEAEVAGIEPGDDLLSVNGHLARSIEDTRKRLTGPLAEDVVLELARDGGSAGGGRATWLVRVRRERVRR